MTMPPVCWGPTVVPGRAVKLGNSPRPINTLTHRPLDLDAFHALRERGRKVDLADHAEEGAGGIGVGEDDLGEVAAAVYSAHARRRPIVDLDLGDFAVGRDLDPVLDGRKPRSLWRYCPSRRARSPRRPGVPRYCR